MDEEGGWEDEAGVDGGEDGGRRDGGFHWETASVKMLWVCVPRVYTRLHVDVPECTTSVCLPVFVFVFV